MNYNICEKCLYIYSTGKNYEDFVGSSMSVIILKGVIYSILKVKGLCPQCNPSTVYNRDKSFCTAVGNRCHCGKINKHTGIICN